MSTPFEARLFTVGELQSDEKVLVVPAYQRPFCWTDKQIEVLVQDLITHFARYSKDKTCRYSLGTVVCHQREALEVLDGQQRLTSVDVLLAVLDQCKAHSNDPEYTVREEDFGWTPSVIRRYDNLTQNNCPEINQTILSSVCLKINGAAKDGLIFSDEEGVTPFEKFADCIRKSVCVLRVILPIDDANPYEGPAMFEIVNMRGQALRSIDIAKATLVESLKDANDAERIAFDRLWSGIAALLRPDPPVTVNDIVKSMGDVLGERSKVSRTDRREGGTKFFEIVGNAFNCKTKLQDQSETDAKPIESSEERRFVVDFENLFVIANEVFRSVKGADDEKFETLNIRPRPGEFDYRGLHDRIVVGKDVKKNAKLDDQERRKDVWRFMSILWIAAMVARQADELLADESKNKSPFALLLDTFYAANGYQHWNMHAFAFYIWLDKNIDATAIFFWHDFNFAGGSSFNCLAVFSNVYSAHRNFVQPRNLFNQFLLFFAQFFVLLNLLTQRLAHRGIRHPHPYQAENKAQQNEENNRHAQRYGYFKVKRPEVKRRQIIIHECKNQNNNQYRQAYQQFHKTHVPALSLKFRNYFFGFSNSCSCFPVLK